MTRVWVDKEVFKNHSDMVAALRNAGVEVTDSIPEAELIHEFDLVIINPLKYVHEEESRRLGVNKSRTIGGKFKDRNKR